MDFEQEKLSITSILLIIGISCLLFTGIMRVLDGVTLSLFLKIGVGSLAAGISLILLKQVGKHLAQSGKRAEKAP